MQTRQDCLRIGAGKDRPCTSRGMMICCLSTLRYPQRFPPGTSVHLHWWCFSTGHPIAQCFFFMHSFPYAPGHLPSTKLSAGGCTKQICLPQCCLLASPLLAVLSWIIMRLWSTSAQLNTIKSTCESRSIYSIVLMHSHFNDYWCYVRHTWSLLATDYSPQQIWSTDYCSLSTTNSYSTS